MTLGPKSLLALRKISAYAIIWVLGATVFVFIEQGILGDANFYPSTRSSYSFSIALATTIPISLLAGLTFGIIEVLILGKTLQKLTFGQKVFLKAFIYTVIMMCVLFSASFINNSVALGKKFWDPVVVQNVTTFFNNFAFWSAVIYGGFITLFVQFYIEVSNNLGSNQLKNFFTGKYHTPKEEERIFMFLDLKDSTTMAEKLGHVRYFDLLQRFFIDISDPIIESWGEVYQYVGDEVVVSWPKKRGLENNNCIRCFYHCKIQIESMADKYFKSFGVVPKFKAGIHLGKVSTGEIGAIKRDILFTGDVLNTTSRIQSACNEFGVDLLISEDLFHELPIQNAQYDVQEMGDCQLRGKNERVKLLNLALK